MNEIYFQDPSEAYKAGILITGLAPVEGYEHILFNNKVYGISTTTYTYPGIKMVGCPEASYICNEVTTTPRGIEIKGGCLNSSIALTEFNNHQVGIFYNPNSQTGNQEYKSNFWKGSYGSGYKIINLNRDRRKIDEYKVYRGDYNTIRDPYPCDPVIIAVYQGYGEYLKCESSPLPRLTDTTFSILDSLIAIDSVLITDFPVAEQWYQDYYLYSKINRFQIPIVQGSVYDSFYMDCQQNGIAEYVDIKEMISTSVVMPDSVHNVLMEYKATSRELISSIAGLDSIYFNGGMVDSVYRIERRGLQDSIEINNMLAFQLISEFAIGRNTTLDNTVIPLINNLSATNNASSIYKKFFRLESKYITESLTDIDSAEILNYATACLERYQNGVLGLQALAVLLDETVSTITDCSPYNFRKKSVKRMEWKLYPNPLEKSIIHLTTDELCSGIVRIYTIEGNKMYSEEFTSGNQLHINIEEKLSPGIYILVINSDNGVWTTKFIKH